MNEVAGEEPAGEEPAGDTGGTDNAGEQAGENYIPPTLGPNDPPPETGRWAEYLPGGDTVCSRGGDYRFYVRGGDPNKVIVDFEVVHLGRHALLQTLSLKIESDQLQTSPKL